MYIAARTRFLLPFFLTLMAAPAYSMTLYKCITSDGSVIYQDHQPEEGQCAYEQTELDVEADLDRPKTTAQRPATDSESRTQAKESKTSEPALTAALGSSEDTAAEALRSAEVAANAAEAAEAAVREATAAADLAAKTGLEKDVLAAERAAEAAEIAADIAEESEAAAEAAELAAELAGAFSVGTGDSQ